MSLELGSKHWKVAFTTGASHRPRVVQLAAGDLGRLWTEVTRAKGRLGLSADTVVRSCYEAGRDGFWLHRALAAQGDAPMWSSIPRASSVDRRARRAKTDRIDATALVIQLMQRHGRRSPRLARRCACRRPRPKRIASCNVSGRRCVRIGRAFAIASRACWPRRA